MGARGESTIQVNGRGDVQVLFTNRAIIHAEQQLKKPIIGVLNGFAAGEIGYTDIVTLLRVGMEAARVDARAGGKPVTNNDALDILDEVGFSSVAAPVMEALAAVIGYNAAAEAGEVTESNDPNF